MLATIGLTLALCQDPSPEERLRASIRAFEKARLQLEDDLRALGPDALPSIDKLAKEGDADTRAAAERAAKRIRDERAAFEAAAAELGDADLDKREKATAALRQGGAGARSYLEKAARGSDAEAAARAQILLAALDRGRASRAIALAEEWARTVRDLEARREKGTASETEVQEARVALLGYRHRAGQLAKDEYLRQKCEMLEAQWQIARRRADAGIGTSREFKAAGLRLTYVRVRLGRATASDLQGLQLEVLRSLDSALRAGAIDRATCDREKRGALTDPDDDLD